MWKMATGHRRRRRRRRFHCRNPKRPIELDGNWLMIHPFNHFRMIFKCQLDAIISMNDELMMNNYNVQWATTFCSVLFCF